MKKMIVNSMTGIITRTSNNIKKSKYHFSRYMCVFNLYAILLNT